LKTATLTVPRLAAQSNETQGSVQLRRRLPMQQAFSGIR
jgi:hypothetical protein